MTIIIAVTAAILVFIWIDRRALHLSLRWLRKHDTRRRLIYVCSPFRGTTPDEETKNVRFAEGVCRDLSVTGAVPFAPHLFFTRYLADDIPTEREAGIVSGLEIMARADEVWFVLPLWRTALSTGMKHELEAARDMGLPVIVMMTHAKYAYRLRQLRHDLMSDQRAKVGA